MAKQKNINGIVKKLCWVALGIAIVVVLVAAMQKDGNTLCKNVAIVIKGNPEQLFLNEKDILQLINAEAIINKKSVKDIDLKKLEAQLEKNIWLANAELYIDKAGILNIEVIERTPLCRIFTQNGQSFYIDKKLFVLPLSSSYSAKVPLFTGFTGNASWSATDSGTLNTIEKMASFIANNSFWMAQIQQVDLTSNNTFNLTPTLGNHTIIFGDTTNMEGKFNKLFKFYKAVSSKVGFDKYSILNVQFKNQLIATSKSNTAIDTATATAAIQQFISNNADSTFIKMDSAVVSNNNAMQKDTIAIAKPVQRTNTAKPTAINRTAITPSNKPKPTTPKPRATMPKPTVVKPIIKKPQQRSQQKKQ